jgi:hypothetical protein
MRRQRRRLHTEWQWLQLSSESRGNPRAGVKGELRELIRLFTTGYLPRLYTGSAYR